MRISPQDIRQQQFTVKRLRGFDMQEVDAFLEDVAEDYESVLKEATLLKEQLAALEERSRGITELERTLQDTLVTTQRLTEEMKASAKREAQLIVQEAELAAEKVVEEARAEEARIRQDLHGLKRMRRQLVEDLRVTLERYQRMMDGDLQATLEATEEEQP
jgi:cell division initiation protein